MDKKAKSSWSKSKPKSRTEKKSDKSAFKKTQPKQFKKPTYSHSRIHFLFMMSILGKSNTYTHVFVGEAKQSNEKHAFHRL